MTYMEELTTGYSRFMFLGESGSGKSEIALNFALEFAARTRKDIHFFDMDQTKPLFRSRDLRGFLESRGIILHHGQSLLDIPVLPPGLETILENPGLISILDTGGNMNGALMAGQFADYFNLSASKVYYVVNYYRPFSYTAPLTRFTQERILWASGNKSAALIINPNLGSATTGEDLITGIRHTLAILEELSIVPELLTVWEVLMDDEFERLPFPVLPIKTYLSFPVNKEAAAACQR